MANKELKKKPVSLEDIEKLVNENELKDAERAKRLSNQITCQLALFETENKLRSDITRGEIAYLTGITIEGATVALASAFAADIDKNGLNVKNGIGTAVTLLLTGMGFAVAINGAKKSSDAERDLIDLENNCCLNKNK